MKKVLNFSAGPSKIPTEVLKIAQEQLLDFNDSGISIMTGSHRAKMFEDVHNETIELIKELYKVPDNYKVLFIQGGASMQFAMLPMNLKQSGMVEFVDTGVWSSKAIKEAKIQGLDVNIIASSEESGYDCIPSKMIFSEDCDYGYITSNNTIYGTQYKVYPKCKNLVVDASSDVFSYPIDWKNIGLLFAGAQKNAGLAGVTIVIIREDLLDIAGDDVPSMLKYKNYAKSNSMFNTPPVFSIYLLNLTMKWLRDQGGVEQIQVQNKQKAKILYDVIDSSEGFYVGHSQKDSRSLMNVSFTIRGGYDELQKKFLSKAEEKGMIGLKGHRLLGGIRASIYNAITIEEVQTLANFMEEFKQENFNKKTYEVLNVKCGGCANTLKKTLKEDFGEVEVDLEAMPRKITLDMTDDRMEELKEKLRSLGYPLTTDELSGFDKLSTTAKSFVSCAIGKMSDEE